MDRAPPAVLNPALSVACDPESEAGTPGLATWTAAEGRLISYNGHFAALLSFPPGGLPHSLHISQIDLYKAMPWRERRYLLISPFRLVDNVGTIVTVSVHSVPCCPMYSLWVVLALPEPKPIGSPVLVPAPPSRSGRKKKQPWDRNSLNWHLQNQPSQKRAATGEAKLKSSEDDGSKSEEQEKKGARADIH